MATIATIQVLVAHQNNERIAAKLEAIKAWLMQDADIVDVRVADAQGPLAMSAGFETTIMIDEGTYQAGSAFRTPSFEVPLGRSWETKPLETGVHTLRVRMPWDPNASSDVDVVTTVAKDGITVDLLPAAGDPDLVGSNAHASMTFSHAQSLHTVGSSGSLLTGIEDVAFEPTRYVLHDKVTGKPIAGLCLSVVAVGTYTHASIVDGAVVHHGVQVFQTLEDKFAHMEATSSSKRTAALYFTDQGEVINTSRIDFVPVPDPSGTQDQLQR